MGLQEQITAEWARVEKEITQKVLIKKTFRPLITELFNALVHGTPVLTGQLRFSWAVRTDGSAHIDASRARDMKGQFTGANIARAKREGNVVFPKPGKSRLSKALGQIKDLNFVVTIGSTLPYAHLVEENVGGWYSKHHMMERAVQQVKGKY